jgi:hypothetical protein
MKCKPKSTILLTINQLPLNLFSPNLFGLIIRLLIYFEKNKKKIQNK